MQHRRHRRYLRRAQRFFALPLTSELDALCGENVNWIPLRYACGAQFKRDGASRPTKGNQDQCNTVATTGIRAMHEDAHTLRLVSKLPDLQVGHVNWIPLRYACGAQFACGDNTKKSTPKLGCFFWRRHPDLNWGMKVLQTFALPLGHGAL